MRGSGRTTEAGFTLLELVIAMLVMSIAVAGLFGVLGTAFQSTAVDIHRTDATSIAAQALSQLEVSPNPASGPLTSVTRNNETYQVATQVTSAQASNGTLNAYPAMSVSVTWTDQGRSHTVTQSSARYPAPTPTSAPPLCAPPTLTSAPLYNSPTSGDPSLDVSWVEPTAGAPVTQWQVQVSPDGSTWTTAIADEAPLPPGATHQVEIGGLAATDAYAVQVVALSACAAPATFPAVPAGAGPPSTPASPDSVCTPGSFTLGPAIATRSATGGGTLTGDITVVVTAPVVCPSGFSASTTSTTELGGTVVDTVLSRQPGGSYSYVGTLAGSPAEWDDGTHVVDLYAGPTATGPVIATAELCVEEQGQSSC
jgi:prepilin-type N-terminal cleavage/methylation domain-containing protein